jgi:hypothetical protein
MNGEAPSGYRDPFSNPLAPTPDPGGTGGAHNNGPHLSDLTIHQLRGRIGNIRDRLDGKDFSFHQQPPTRGKNEELHHQLLQMLKFQRDRMEAFQRSKGQMSQDWYKQQDNNAVKFGTPGFSKFMQQNTGVNQPTFGMNPATPLPTSGMTQNLGATAGPLPQMQMQPQAPANPVASFLANMMKG